MPPSGPLGTHLRPPTVAGVSPPVNWCEGPPCQPTPGHAGSTSASHGNVGACPARGTGTTPSGPDAAGGAPPAPGHESAPPGSCVLAMVGGAGGSDRTQGLQLALTMASAACPGTGHARPVALKGICQQHVILVGDIKWIRCRLDSYTRFIMGSGIESVDLNCAYISPYHLAELRFATDRWTGLSTT